MNQNLLNYIDILERNENASNKGKDISEVKKKSRTLNIFLTRAQNVLWFSKAIGLELQSVTVIETETGKLHIIGTEQAQDPSGVTSNNEEQSRGFEAIPDQEKANVERILFLLGKCSVGDCFYHELTMVIDGLPKAYLVKQRRHQLNKICHVTPTPGVADGAQTSCNDLLTERIRDHLASNPDDYDRTMKIKISGEGARMTRNSSFILLSFALLQAADDVMAAKGNHTIAVVKGKEDYTTLQASFADIFLSINNLIKTKQIIVDGKTVMFWGGNYKFILLMMGLKGATSHYACVWCKVHKDSR